MNGNRDQIPIGMRVLAVGEDSICLKSLEDLLLQCQYQVTRTYQAVVALRMLRKYRDRFDLVIADDHMPDMDGFKLLELIGLEMNLPVIIMLSANAETQAVTKGITDGAVGYLLKPLRIEDLKDIWKHVVRRKQFVSKNQNNADSGDDRDKVHLESFEGGPDSAANGSSDRNGKINKARKEQDEEGGDDEEIDSDSEDLSVKKKSRCVWTVDLHCKFIDAVNQLGVDKAVPKKILDLMNVERLTRENVSSHLQMYRQHLQRLSLAEKQQANLVAAARKQQAKQQANLVAAARKQQANLLAAFGGRHPSSYLPMESLDESANFDALMRPRSFLQPNGSTKLTGFPNHGFMPSGSGQLGRSVDTITPINELEKYQRISRPTLSGSHQHGSHQGTLLTGMPIPLEQELQRSKANEEARRNVLGDFTGSGVLTGHPIANRPFVLQESQHKTTHSGGHFGQSFVGDSFHFAEPVRYNETWRVATPSIQYPSNPLPPAFSRSDLSSSNVRNNVIGNSKLNWQGTNQAYVQNSNDMYNSLQNSSLPNIGLKDRSVGNQTLGNGFSSEKMDVPINGQTSFDAPFVAQDPKIVKTDVVGQFNHKDESFSEDMKSHGYGSNSGGLDDLVNSLITSACSCKIEGNPMGLRESARIFALTAESAHRRLFQRSIWFYFFILLLACTLISVGFLW